MADNSTHAEDSPIRGFSIIDSLSTKLTDTGKEETRGCVEDIVDVEEKEDDNAVGDNAGHPGKEIDDDIHPADDNEIIILDDNDHKEDKEPTSSTLIITTEDILESTTTENAKTIAKCRKEKEEAETYTETIVEEPKIKGTKVRLRKGNYNCVWVSNIGRHVKAADLKKLFAQFGKVVTAKILTNGKSYFGYVSMISGALATKCVERLNDTPFDGRKIVVSKDRPDIKNTKSAVKPEAKKKKIEKAESREELDDKKEKATKSKSPCYSRGDSVASEIIEKKPAEEHSSEFDTIVVDLKKQLGRAREDANRYKYKVLEYQRRHEGMRKKCEAMEKEMKDAQFKIRNERRRLNQDREQFEKNKKLEQTRLDADRIIVDKELEEVKKLREDLKDKIEELKTQTKKPPKRRSRSPLTRARNIPRARSPPLRSNNSSNLFRSDEKKRKREDLSRGRTPPPPKLSEGLVKKRGDRGPENSAPSRSYLIEGEKRSSALSHEYEYRHKPYGIPKDEPRSSWPCVFPKDPRRPASGPSDGQGYIPDMRYGVYQLPMSSVPGLPRNYYPDFGKPYGPY